MAKYSITPYLFQVNPNRKPSEQMKMGRLTPGKEISASDLVANTLIALLNENEPREKSNDPTRLIDITRVARNDEQVYAECKVGVKGFSSSLDLSALDDTVTRTYDDAEWFNLRIFFIAPQGLRSGLLLVERVANYGVLTQISELIKSAYQKNVSTTERVRFEPIQNMEILGEALEDMILKAVEFRTISQDAIQADAAAEENFEQPFKKQFQRPLKKMTRYSTRGSMGNFSLIKGKSPEEIANTFGYILGDKEATDIVAKVETSDGTPRTLSVEDQQASAISFTIEQNNEDKPPTKAEFFETVKIAVESAADLLGTTEISIHNFQTDDEVTELDDELQWKLDDEPTA